MIHLANALTFARLLATPFVVWLILGGRHEPAMYAGAMLLFLAAMGTDIADGVLARRFGKTALGNYLDPIADKVLVLSTCVALMRCEMLPVWVTLVFICREFIVSGVRDVAALEGRMVGANWMGSQA